MAIIKKKPRRGKKVIDLTGPQGNAYFLLGAASELCYQLKIDFKTVEDEMTSSDYENLIAVFDKYFGDYVDLER